MMHDKTVLVLGGGTGGIVVANRLRKKLPRQHRVVLIEREANHVFAPSFLWLMTGLRTPEKISRPLSKLEKHGIELIRGVQTSAPDGGKQRYRLPPRTSGDPH